MILSSQALHQHRRHCLQAVTHDFAWFGVAPKVLDGVKVVLAQAQQGHVTFNDLAVGNARANWEGWIGQRIDIDTLEIFANEYQSSV